MKINDAPAINKQKNGRICQPVEIEVNGEIFVFDALFADLLRRVRSHM
jgi:hypothetical protein